MAGKLNNRIEKRAYLITGNLNDFYLGEDLVELSFEEFLHRYLKSIGYKHVVFFSDIKHLYVLDEEDAILLGGLNNKNVINESESSNSSSGLKRHKMGGRHGALTETGNTADKKIETQSGDDNSASRISAVYRKKNITVNDFYARSLDYMSGVHGKTAVVVTDMESFLKAKPPKDFAGMFREEWMTHNSDNNIGVLIFLAPYCGKKSLSEQLVRNEWSTVNDYFFPKDANGNILESDAIINIGCPKKDEIQRLLQMVSVVGFKADDGNNIHLCYNMDDFDQIVACLMQTILDRSKWKKLGEGLEKNYTITLSNMYRFLRDIAMEYYAEEPKCNAFELELDDIRELLECELLDSSKTALEQLNKTGWENVYNTVKEIVEDAERLRNDYAKEHKEKRRVKGFVIDESDNVPANDNKRESFGSERIDQYYYDSANQGKSKELRIGAPQFILQGKPGTGKSSIARLIGSILYEAKILKTDKVIELHREDLVGNHIGDTEVAIRNAIADAEEGVLFIDEAYTLMSEKNDENSGINWGKIIVDALLPVMDAANPNHHECVILAGYANKMKAIFKANQGIKDRVITLNLEDATPELMREKFEDFIEKQGYHIPKTVDPDTGAECDSIDVLEYFNQLYKHRTEEFSNYRAVRNTANSVCMRAAKRDAENHMICMNDFYEQKDERKEEEKRKRLQVCMDELDGLIGLEGVKEKIRDLISVKNIAEIRKVFNIQGDDTSTLHLVFTGNPGTGKTTVARLVGEILYLIGALPYNKTLEVQASKLLKGYKNQTATNTEDIVEDALGGVLFIDEAHQLAYEGSCGQEAINVIVPASENHRDELCIILAGYTDAMENMIAMDDGLESRFSTKIQFDDYNIDELMQIFEIEMKKKALNIYGEEVKDKVRARLEYMKKTEEHFSNGRAVRNLVEKILTNNSVRLNMIDSSQIGEEDLRTVLPEDVPD